MDLTHACSLCGAPAADRACQGCAAPHHSDCWEYAEGCSIYGCGASGWVGPDGTVGKSAPVVVDEASLAPAPRPALFQALSRRIWRDLPILPQTLMTGWAMTLAAAAVILAGPVDHLGTPIDFFGPPLYTVLLPCFLIGTGVGLFGAFGGRAMHQTPRRVARRAFLFVLSCVIVLGCRFPDWFASWVLDPSAGSALWLMIRGGGVALILSGAAVGVTLVASAVSEVCFGPRSRLGPRQGWTWSAVRLLTIGVMIFGQIQFFGHLCAYLTEYRSGGVPMFFAWLFFQEMPYAIAAYMHHAVLATAVLTLAAYPVLEQGKGAYLERLPPARRGGFPALGEGYGRRVPSGRATRRRRPMIGGMKGPTKLKKIQQTVE